MCAAILLFIRKLNKVEFLRSSPTKKSAWGAANVMHVFLAHPPSWTSQRRQVLLYMGDVERHQNEDHYLGLLKQSRA